MFKKLAIIFGTFLASLILAGSVYASSDLSIRLEQPKSPTNQDTFGITFVAMDVNGNPLTVTCYMEGPNANSFSQFGSPITLSNGGNTDNCPVTSSQINTNGTYQFYAIVNNGSETAQSPTVSVDFNTNGPGTPTNYSKDHPNSCTYLIHFTTASDNGETAYVEVYRSTNTSFSLDSSTKVYSVNVGSNSNQTFTDVVPNCNQTYYYEVRAFDSAGNGSGVVGDGGITITNSSTSQTSGSNGSTNAGNGAIPVNNSSSEVTSPTVSPSEAPTGTTAKPTGSQSVLGAQKNPSVWDQAMNAVNTHKGITILVILTLIVILAGIFFWMKQRTSR